MTTNRTWHIHLQYPLMYFLPNTKRKFISLVMCTWGNTTYKSPPVTTPNGTFCSDLLTTFMSVLYVASIVQQLSHRVIYSLESSSSIMTSCSPESRSQDRSGLNQQKFMLCGEVSGLCSWGNPADISLTQEFLTNL